MINLDPPHYFVFLLGFEDLIVDVVLERLAEVALLRLLFQLRLSFGAATTLFVLSLILSLIPLQTDVRAGVCGTARGKLHACRGEEKKTLYCCHDNMKKSKGSAVTCSSNDIVNLLRKTKGDSDLSGSSQTYTARCPPLVSGTTHGSV